MVYKNLFASAVKVNGKVLRETQETVTIPFGSEYSVLLKNLNSVRSMVKVSVDGQDATEGTWLVIQPNSNIELERFIRDGNLQAGNRFKFIERTEQIEAHRGIKSEDGLIRIEYKFERKTEEVPVKRYRCYDEWVPVERPYYPSWYQSGLKGSYANAFGGVLGNSVTTVGTASNTSETVQFGQNVMAMNCTLTKSAETERSGWRTQDFNDNGITVAGSESSQRFTATSWFDTEASNVLIIKLKGSQAGSKVITVQDKPKCDICGKYNKATSKFCDQCGTALILV
jgi:hypothetical protein